MFHIQLQQYNNVFQNTSNYINNTKNGLLFSPSFCGLFIYLGPNDEVLLVEGAYVQDV